MKIGIFPLLAGIASPILLLLAVLQGIVSDRVADTWRSSSGVEYSILKAPVTKTNAVALGRRIGPSSRAYTVLARSYGKDEYGSLRIVRPLGFGAKTRIVNRSGLLLGVGRGYLWVAYDLANQRSYGDPSEPDGRVQTLSPFVLLGPKDQPNLDDFAVLMKADGDERPSVEAVKQDLDNPNPKVREMAKKLLKSLKTNPPFIP